MLKDLDSWQKIILHIDYDSFFASVEQQANPFLRGKPIGITGSSLTRGVVCTASKEAKRFGIKTGMALFEAKKLCPNLLIIKGDFTKYLYIHEKSMEIFGLYTDLVEAFSIDEAFLDITKTYKFFGSPQDVAFKIKTNIEKFFGPYVTCSIGIAPNKLLAKLVSDINKPNGLYIVTKENLETTLKTAKLTDFCGIGKRISNRLINLGITNIQELQHASKDTLYKEFGNIESAFLKNLSFGIDSTEVKSADYEKEVKSISHEHTLSKNTKDPRVIKSNLRRLTEMVAKRLREKNMLAKTIHISLKDAHKNYYSWRTTLLESTQSSQKIYDAVQELFNETKWNQETRFVGIGVSNLINKTELPIKLPLFQQEERQEKIWELTDKINDKWGDFTIVPASTILADKTKGKISSFLKH